MLSVEKIENTLSISKPKSHTSSLTTNETSRGLSSGNLEVFKTGSELCLRPGSPDRYKSISEASGLTPSTRLTVVRNSPSLESFHDLTGQDLTPVKDLSMYLELDIEEVPNIGTSFFSSGEKDLQFFERRSESFHSFSSTTSKTDKQYQEFIQNMKESRKNYKNNCKIRCCKCENFVTTDVKLVYPSVSL
jgi:hypothetical protein